MPQEVQRWLLLRGLTREKGHWGSFLREFELQFSHADIHALDLPGCGKHYKEFSPFSIPGIVDYLLKQEPLKDWHKNGIEFGILGLSMGGLVALELAQKAKSCQRVVLVNSSLTSLSPPWHRLRPRALLKLFSIFSRWNHADRENLVLQLVSENFSNCMKTQAQWRQIHLQHPVTRVSAIAQLIASSQYVPRRSKLGQIRALILCGGKDQVVYAKSGYRMAQWLKAAFVLQPNAGHDLTLDDPAWVCAQVAEWVNRS